MRWTFLVVLFVSSLSSVVPPQGNLTKAIASTGNAFMDQGTCAVVYEAQTEHTDAYGTYEVFGAAWGRATLQDAQAAARADVFRSLGSTRIGAPLLGANSDGMKADASGCGQPHGAVVGELKRNAATQGYWGSNVFADIEAALSSSTADATAAAKNACRPREDCRIVAQW